MTKDLGVWTADDCALVLIDYQKTAELLIALFVGLSVPVIGAGVALDRGASAPNTVLGFAILVGLGVAGAGWGLLARRPKNSPQVA
jgi:hypothetical protein